MLSKKTLSLLLLGALTWLLLLSSPVDAAPMALSSNGKGKPGRPDPAPAPAPHAPAPAPPAPAPVHTPAPNPSPKPSPKPSSSASPRPTPSKPAVPKDKAELRKDYFKKAPKKDGSCFFTGMDITAQPAKNTMEAKKQCKSLGLVTLEDIWKKSNIVNRKEWAPSSADEWSKFTIMVSEVFAEETSGVAYLLMPDSLKPRASSIYYANEFPAMKKSGKVDKIMHINFDPNLPKGQKPTMPDSTKDDRVWWKKGAADPPTRS